MSAVAPGRRSGSGRGWGTSTAVVVATAPPPRQLAFDRDCSLELTATAVGEGDLCSVEHAPWILPAALRLSANQTGSNGRETTEGAESERRDGHS